MKRRTYIKLSSTVTAGGALLPVTEWLPEGRLKNWAGNIEYSTNNIHYPKTREEVQDLVKRYSKLKALGTRHCFNRIADSHDFFLSTNSLNEVISLDSKTHTVTIGGGIKYGELAPYLHKNVYVLPNLAFLSNISVAGFII